MSSFTFYSTIPQPGDNPSISQGQLLQNFTSLDSIIGVDHVGFNIAQGGEHNQVTFALNQAAPALPAGAVSELYANLSGGLSELFFKNSTTDAQLTQLPRVTTTPGATGFGFKTPWGITLNWGSIPSVGTGGTNVVFQVPYTSAVQSIQLTSRNTGSSSATTSNETTTGFKATSTNTNAVYFFAIGV